jgi:hypothetical protein
MNKVITKLLKQTNMGWWSTDIMGGDTPLDFEDAFFDICNVDKFPEGGGTASLTKEDFAKHLDKMLEEVHRYKDDQNIGYQVLAVLMLKAGAFISGDLQDFMMQACENDEWAMENLDRKRATVKLWEALSMYDNERPIVINSKGLFEVMFEKISGTNE